MPSKADVENESDAELVAWGLDIESGLTEWEVGFLEDMRKLVKGGTKLTHGRRKKLEQIIMEKG